MTFKRPPARPAKIIEHFSPPVRRPPRDNFIMRLLDDWTPVPGASPTSPPPKADPSLKLANKIRESARGEDCTVRLTGVCSFDPAKTIWSHARWGAQLGDGGRGMATKALDLCGAYACTDCDAVFDGQRRAPHLTREQIDLDWCKGHFRSLGRLHEKGLV